MPKITAATIPITAKPVPTTTKASRPAAARPLSRTKAAAPPAAEIAHQSVMRRLAIGCGATSADDIVMAAR
jgi:hypothetical protein